MGLKINQKRRNMKFNLLFAAAACAVTMSANAQAQAPKAPEYEFTVVKELPVTPVKNQYRSGTCWCYSALSFIESEILRTKGIETDLSEMFVVGKSYHDRAIKYVRLDGALRFSPGSSFGDVLHVIEDYGIVPQEAMPGMNYGTKLPEQNELDAVLKGYVDAVAENPNKKLTTAWVNGFDGIVSAYLGAYPETFAVNGTSYTPESYRDFLGLNADDYVNLSSFSHHPFYEQFIIEVPDNWRWDTAYNLPIDEFMAVMEHAVMNGYTIAWGSDISEKGFTRNGIGIMPVEKTAAAVGSDQEKWVGKAAEKKEVESTLPEEVIYTQEMRQDGSDRKPTTDDHGMHIYGIAKDQNGTKYYMVKNSWGETGKYKGIWYASEPFVRAKTLNIVVHKDALPKDIKKKLGIK